MKHTLTNVLLLLVVSVSVVAQQRTVKLRLFWQHPPTKVRIVPEDASIRLCPTCPSKRLSKTLHVDGEGSSVVAGANSSSILFINGRARITGDSFSPFTVDDELRIQSRESFLLLTLTMPLEEYVASVLQGESTAFKSDEALKGMAVSARTYAVHFGSRHQQEGFDFCDTTHCQDVRLGNESTRVKAAVIATEGELLWFQGRPAATYYHRSCGGEIDSAEALDKDLHAPYLRQHHDEYCTRTPAEWHAEIRKADLTRALGRPANAITIAARANSGRVLTLLVENRPISATDFRLAVGRALGWDRIRSDLYQIEDLGEPLSFRGRGQGHGVGLCQSGADNMGEQGHSYREILAFYYPGTALGLNANGLSWEKLPSESLDLITTDRGDAAVLLPAAEQAMHFATQQTGWNLNSRPQIKVYPTVAIYRDATGEPGWVAASTMGSVIRLQPVSTLQRTHALDSTLRHEFLHLLIESHARRETPLWLREGLALYISNPDAVRPASVDVAKLEKRLHSLRSQEEMRSAYRQCAVAVAEAIQKNGLGAVLSRLSAQDNTH